VAAAIGLLSSVELDVSDHPDPAALLVDVRHEAYERGLIVRLAEAEGVLTIVLYPTLVASEDDVRSGTATSADVVVDKVGACVAVRDGRVYDRPR
jgi:adenosylmethionine-8-amino-7-oxononanoate aminotransferase